MHCSCEGGGGGSMSSNNYNFCTLRRVIALRLTSREEFFPMRDCDCGSVKMNFPFGFGRIVPVFVYICVISVGGKFLVFIFNSLPLSYMCDDKYDMSLIGRASSGEFGLWCIARGGAQSSDNIGRELRARHQQHPAGAIMVVKSWRRGVRWIIELQSG